MKKLGVFILAHDGERMKTMSFLTGALSVLQGSLEHHMTRVGDHKTRDGLLKYVHVFGHSPHLDKAQRIVGLFFCFIFVLIILFGGLPPSSKINTWRLILIMNARP